MYLLIKVGGYIGAWPTIGLVMLTAVIGISLLRIQGLSTLTRGLSRLEGGSLPAREMVEGLLLAVAGALLLTPGFVTDLVGFVLLAPTSRGLLAQRILSNVTVAGATYAAGQTHPFQQPFRQGGTPGGPPGAPGAPGAPEERRREQVIEGTFSKVPEASNTGDTEQNIV